MTSLSVTNTWSDPSASLTADQIYIVQNRSSGWLRFFEGATFDASANDNDGIMLAPMQHRGSAPNHMRWTYNSTNSVRLRLDTAVGDETARVEFALSA